MDLSTRVLGEHIVTQLKDRAATPVLVIGADRFTRADLAGLACFNFTAAANLTTVLSRGLKVRNTKEVFDQVTPEVLAAIPRLGAISLACLGAAFEAKGLGGEAPLEAWVARHFPKDKKVVTFATLKLRDQAEQADERKRHKARKAARRNTAHTTRVSRFAARSSAADNGAPAHE